MKKQQIMKEIFGSLSDEEMANSSDELQNKDNSTGGLEPAHEGKPKCEGGEASRSNALKGVHLDPLGSSSRSPDNEKGKDKVALLAALMHEVFGDTDDDEPVENEKKRSPKDKGDYAEGSRATNAKPDGDETYEFEKERTKTNLKGKGVAPVEVFQIPLRAPPAPPNKMATIKLSNLIGIDPMTFDEEDIYATDEFGSKRLVPSSNIIRFREVKKPDGTISVESNARFVEWSDGSLQLLIGNEAFDVSEQDAKEIQSHLFLKHGREIYQCQGKISRKMNFMPSSLSSNSHRSLAALVDSRHKKVNKVRRYIPDQDPEVMMKLNQKAETQISKTTKQLNVKKKKVYNKYTPGFLEDSDDERPKYTHGSAMSSVKSPMEALNISKNEKVKMGDQFKGKEVVGSMSCKKVAEMQESNEEELHDGSEGPKGKSKVSGSKLKKQVIESDDEMPPVKTATRRRNAIVYDSSDE